MRLPDTTLRAIVALLAAADVKTNERSVEIALADLGCPEMQACDNLLRPGEVVVVMNHHDNEYEVFDTIEAAKKAVTEFLDQRSNPEDYTSDIDIHISRKQINASVTVAVTFE